MTPPPYYDRILVVDSFAALVAAPFAAGRNAICWQRNLPGDFAEVATQLDADEGITTLDPASLSSLRLSAAGRVAIAALVADQERLRSIGHEPSLDCVRSYPRDDEAAPVPTHVYSFHVDSATTATDTFLCSYTAPASEGLRLDQARRSVDVPAIRARLLQGFGGADGDEFVAYLHEHRFDLHYVATPGATPFSFGIGNLWRIAVQYPGSPVPACIHRAPEDAPGLPPRLLLIS